MCAPLIGIVKLMDIAITLIQAFNRHLLRKPKDLFADYGGPNKWAVVTGASDGIGE